MLRFTDVTIPAKLDHLYTQHKRINNEINPLVGRFLSEAEQCDLRTLESLLDDIEREILALGGEL